MEPTIIIAEDIDVLDIFCQHITSFKNMYFCKSSKGQKAEEVYHLNSYYNHAELDRNLSRTLKSLVGFIHGCPECNTFHYEGRNKIVKLLSNNSEVTIFKNPKASHKQIRSTGLKTLSALDISREIQVFDLNTLRYVRFKKRYKKIVYICQCFHLHNPQQNTIATVLIFKSNSGLKLIKI